jgi:hypothetical protein
MAALAQQSRTIDILFILFEKRIFGTWKKRAP